MLIMLRVMLSSASQFRSPVVQCGFYRSYKQCMVYIISTLLLSMEPLDVTKKTYANVAVQLVSIWVPS